MRKTIAGFCMALWAVLGAVPGGAAVLENPGPGRLYSGIGVISGWKCEAGDLTVRFNGGERIPVLYGAERTDVRDAGACAQARVGFVTIWNWGNLGEGEHEVVAYDDGEEFGRATFTVGSTGEEFLQGATRAHLLENFPVPGETTVLEWNEASQHFEIRGVLESAMGDGYDPAWWRQVSMDTYNYYMGHRPYAEPEFLYAEVPDIDSCFAGRLTQAAKDRALEAMNQIRALHGLAPVQYSRRYDEQVQEASLIQAANGYPGHFPEESAKCYTEDGAVGSGTSNLGGWPGGFLQDLDPAWNMLGWTNDARNLALRAAVGHRRWVLNPFVTYMSYGQVRGYAAQKVHSFDEEPVLTPEIAVEYVAFPYETYPFLLVEGDPPWSFSVVEDKQNFWGNLYHPYFDQARIRVVRVADGERLAITDQYTDTEGVGNLLSWQVAGWEYDTLYEVEISGVSLRSGVTQSYSYPVFIDRANIEYVE